MSLSAGLIVANLYYNQPLLNLIADTFDVTEAAVSNVALSTQLGYAFGLLLINPLGDMLSNHKILNYDFVILILALMGAGLSKTLTALIISSFFIGFSSAVPQLFVPMAAQFSDENSRGRAIGIVMSGLLIGILGSRIISGFIGEQFGWRVMYYAATFIMVGLLLVLNWKLPQLHPNYNGTYGKLMGSLWHYFKTEPLLRLAALRGALGFAGLSAFWTTLVFLMEDSFGYGSTVAGAFGAFGVAGALGAAVVGKLSDTVSKHKILIFSAILLMVSWVIFFISAHSVFGLIIGVILIDLGLQSLHITNQNIIFSKNPQARNRVNTIYMVGFFIGGSVGTTLGAIAWQYFGWLGVSSLGMLLAITILMVILFNDKASL